MATAVVNTVTGPVSPDDLGVTLMHEHILYGYPGWEGDQSIAPFDGPAMVKNSVAVLEMLKSLGLKTYVDATALDGGRCPEIYREVSEKTGIQIVCSTGYYYEGEGSSAYWKFRSALGDAAEELYELYMREITVGIRDTGIRAGVIKVGTSKDGITDYESMMLKVAARVQKETGVPIITHTQEGTMGPEQAALLIAEGVDPAKIQIGHMSDNLDMDYQQRTLAQGVYVSWDRMGLQGLVGCPMDEQRYPVMIELIKKGHGNRLMISHDCILNWLGRPLTLPEEVLPLIANWNPAHLFQNIIPVLKAGGVMDEQIDTIVRENPCRLFAA
ncbi:MAG: phosphotriesterase-related protein [Desulfobacterales bacterium]|nr:phosphotriesterase-related protein [Desulfobacterales bacterium]